METNEVQVYNQFPEVVKKAPVTLKENKDRISRAVLAGESLLAKVQKEGMSATLDKEINDYLVKVKATLKFVKDQRTPITQMIQAISKEFTESEQSLDSKRSDTTWYKLQKCRDDHAKQLAEEAAEKEAEKQLEVNKNLERTTLGANVQENVKLKFSEHLFNEKEGLRSLFNDITLDDWSDTIALINSYETFIDKPLYRTWIYNYRPLHISQEEVNEIIKDTMLEMLDILNVDLAKEISDMKQSLSTEYPAKKKELEALKTANTKEKTRLEKEAGERKIKQEQELLKEKKDAEEKTKLEAESQKQQLEMETMFDQAEVDNAKPKRTGFSISLTHQKGLLPIMNLWFEQEGHDMAMDAAMKVTIDRMLRFCEKHAHKNDEKIESPYLKYSEEFKQKAK